MDEAIYDDLALEETIADKFNIKIDIKNVIARNIAVSRTSSATVFLSKNNKLFCYIDGQEALTLGIVQKFVKRMHLVAKTYLPPAKQDSYFEDIASTKFRQVFPGHNNPRTEDLRYYRLLAPYKPALIEISEVSGGAIYKFDPQDSTNWRVAAKLTYRRIATI